MRKNTDELSRETKEIGFRVYKWILNIFTIVLLIQLYRSLYINIDDNYWVYGIGVLYFTVRLVVFASRERKAFDAGIPVTEWMERRNEELENRNNN